MHGSSPGPSLTMYAVSLRARMFIESILGADRPASRGALVLRDLLEGHHQVHFIRRPSIVIAGGDVLFVVRDIETTGNERLSAPSVATRTNAGNFLL